jgi:RNA 2',3'-cyclic 3'-phosphodiesterase
MTLRLFLAIPVPEEVIRRLASLQRDLPGASWRPPETFHLTLRFFGEIDEALARDLDEELGRINAAPFEMRLKGAGSFGGREPSAVWAGAEAPPALARIAARCETAARRVGLVPEKRTFKPHVTLAYLHGTTDAQTAAYQQRLGAFETELFWVDHFAMYSSHGTKHGSRYVEQAVYPLLGAPTS